MQRSKPLTDFEIEALQHDLNLADGHAYQDTTSHFLDIIEAVGTLWEECETMRIPDIEYRFRNSFAVLAGSAEMTRLPFFKICPSASNSIDIIGAILAQQRLVTRLVEPTFDNLALLLRRRRVTLEPLIENDIVLAAACGSISTLLDTHSCGAVFLVQPNNPTGRSLDANTLQAIAERCAARHKILIIDNSFRFYNRHPFDDYLILVKSGVSFVALEDTGKVWPTHDLKASLLFCSPDLETIVTAIYNELYMCNSRFTLALLEKFILKTAEVGLAQTIWRQVDEHRNLLRRTIVGTDLIVDATASDSKVSVEWLDCRGTGVCDLELTKILAAKGLLVLPGRQFFWHSSAQDEHQFNVRLALMKPVDSFRRSMEIVRCITRRSVSRGLEQ